MAHNIKEFILIIMPSALTTIAFLYFSMTSSVRYGISVIFMIVICKKKRLNIDQILNIQWFNRNFLLVLQKSLNNFLFRFSETTAFVPLVWPSSSQLICLKLLGEYFFIYPHSWIETKPEQTWPLRLPEIYSTPLEKK